MVGPSNKMKFETTLKSLRTPATSNLQCHFMFLEVLLSSCVNNSILTGIYAKRPTPINKLNSL